MNKCFEPELGVEEDALLESDGGPTAEAAGSLSGRHVFQDLPKYYLLLTARQEDRIRLPTECTLSDEASADPYRLLLRP